MHCQGVLVAQGKPGKKFILGLKELFGKPRDATSSLRRDWCENTGCRVVYSPSQATVIFLSLIHSRQDQDQDLNCFLHTSGVLT